MELLIGGTWQAAASGRTEDVTSPFDGSVVGTVPVAGLDDVDAALAAAEAGARYLAAHAGPRADADPAAGGRRWPTSGPRQIAQTISAEAGKTITEARGEASRSGELIRLAAFEGTQLYGDSLPLDANRGTGFDKIGFTVRQPVGVVVAITPFNYPALLVLHKLAPALAAGQRGRAQAGPHHPADRAGAGRVLRRRRPARGRAVGAHRPRRRARRRAGQRPAGATRSRSPARPPPAQRITQLAGVKKLSLELGASCPVVVLPDADIDAAAAAVALGGFVNAGQVCISVQRVITHPAIAGDFLDALVPRVEKISTGDPRSADTAMGTLITAAGGRAGRASPSARAVDERSHAADRRRARRRDHLPGRGRRCRPGVAVQPGRAVRPGGRGSARPTDWQSAIAQANGTAYGLGAGIFTSDVSGAVRAIREIDAGTIHINWTPLWRADLMPYGGLKGSGIGKEGPRSAVAEMTDVKTVILHGRPW